MAAPRPHQSTPRPQGGIRLPGRAALLAELADLAKLRRPVTAAAAGLLIAEAVSPWGLNVGPDGAKLTGALVALGVLAGLVQRAIER